MGKRSWLWWVRISVFSALVLSGQASATLLGRLYFQEGGHSKWLETLVQIIGFPILLPYFFFVDPKMRVPTDDDNVRDGEQLSLYGRMMFFLVSGVILAAGSMLFSVGLLYLPVSTFSLISASQLAFTAIFAYFLNSQKFTALTINSIVVLTVSSILLVIQPNSASSNATNPISSEKYAAGFVCTLLASAGCALLFNIAQLYFQKVRDRTPIAAIFEYVIYESAIATAIVLVGLFASGEWRMLRQEMELFGLGKLSYVMTLTWTAITWQVCTIGVGGLIYEVSSVFTNVISALGLPIVPVLAMVFFHDRMDGVKAISMVLAIWGFLSYVYQQYLDENCAK
ncbi:hypothetical protein MLD38_016705 [Melastoma candidum]|nr:hypothetical protein MLD38_016705 [Melastoma candidum]